MINKEYIRAMPKIDLHCHLDGSLPSDTIIELAKVSGIAVPDEPKAFQKSIMVPASCNSLSEYLGCFELAVSSLQRAENLYKAAFDLIVDVAKENVVHIEIRFAPLLHTYRNLSLHTIIDSVIQGARDAGKINGISVGIILCAMRHDSYEDNIRLLEAAEKFIGHGVVAMDLAGDEKMFPTSSHSKLFQQVKERCIPFTIHAGEADGPTSIDAAIDFGAKRIGHGIAMKDSVALMALCRKNNIGIELCPVSNLQTNTVSSWSDYPFRLFMNNDVPISINTDNRTVSQTSLTREFCELDKIYHLSTQEMEILYRNAVKNAFLDEKQKHCLNSIYDKFLNSVEDIVNYISTKMCRNNMSDES